LSSIGTEDYSRIALYADLRPHFVGNGRKSVLLVKSAVEFNPRADLVHDLVTIQQYANCCTIISFGVSTSNSRACFTIFWKGHLLNLQQPLPS